jgi:F-type H+-transporting ATPase subunit b
MHRSLVLAVLSLTVGALPALAQERGGGPLTVEGGLMVWTVFIFLLLLFVLRRFAWPQILGAVEARERRLEEQIAEAERNRTESARLLEEQRKLLADARQSAHSIVTEAKSMAEKERTAALEKARHEQEELVARARREIAAERERAVAELRREAVELSLAAASKVIGERLSSDTDRRIVEEYLANLETGP